MKPTSVVSFIFVLVFLTAMVNAITCHDVSYSNNYTAPNSFSLRHLDNELFDDCLLVATSATSLHSILPRRGGIKEVVPNAFKLRYERWKSELLSTEYGKQLWLQYADNNEISLKIIVTGDRKNGAGTDDFKWDKEGKLIEATIFLGKDLDKGFPDPIYYPVMNSLGSLPLYVQTGNILASAKMAHELGHVEQIAAMNGGLFQKQNKLIAAYYKIFLQNGYDATDPRLQKVVEELGAKPMEIWQDREYWSEVSAMKYLVNRLDKAVEYCSFTRKTRTNISSISQNYSSRFDLLDDHESFGKCGL